MSDDIRQRYLDHLRKGLNFLPDSSKTATAVVIGLQLAVVDIMRRQKHLSAEDAVMEVRRLYAAVEAAHPGQWEALGGPPLPDALK